MAVVLVIEAANQSHLAANIQGCQSQLNTEITNATGDTGTVTLAAEKLSNATADTGGYLTLRSNLETEQTTLNTMLGKASGNVVTTSDVINAINTAVNANDLSDILALAIPG